MFTGFDRRRAAAFNLIGKGFNARAQRDHDGIMPVTRFSPSPPLKEEEGRGEEAKTDSN